MLDVGADRVDQVLPCNEQLGPDPGQVRVPDVERAHDGFAGASPSRPVPPARPIPPARLRPGRLQQRRALLEHPVVVGADGRVPGCHRDQQVIHEPPALTGISLDERQVLGREQHGAEGAQHLAWPAERHPVEPDAVGPARVDLDLHEVVPRSVGNARADDGLRGTLPDQRGVLGDPVTGQRRDVANRLDEVGLALAVRAAEDRDPWRQRDIHARIRAEVRQRQASQVHPSIIADAGQPSPTRSPGAAACVAVLACALHRPSAPRWRPVGGPRARPPVGDGGAISAPVGGAGPAGSGARWRFRTSVDQCRGLKGGLWPVSRVVFAGDGVAG